MEILANSYSEFQPLLDFEEETLAASPYNDLSELTREVAIAFSPPITHY